MLKLEAVCNDQSWLNDLSPIFIALHQEQPLKTGVMLSSEIEAQTMSESWDSFNTTAFNQLPFSKRYDVAVLTLTNKTDATTEQVLTKLRDLFAKKVIVIVNTELVPELDFIALGFTKISLPVTQQAQGIEYWNFNILTYKQVPDWLNARFWANPENFNKFRW